MIKMKVKLVIQPKMQQDEWLAQLTQFVEQLSLILAEDDVASAS
jgi:hypothetical protein